MSMQIHRGRVFEVDRGRKRFRGGQGMIKGMGVIWSHWSKSWTRKLTNMSEIDGVFTVQYPDEQLEMPQAYRNMPILLYDDETGHELCTSCFQCERVCPPQVIHIKQAKHPETGKPIPLAEEFIIEYDACMSCGFCAEVCPFDSIKMDHHFELSTHDHPSMTVYKEGLMRPVSYYAEIAPDFWEAAKANAYKKLDGTKKRRPGQLGVAPEFLEKGPPPKAAPVSAPKAAPAPAEKAALAPKAAPAAPPAAVGKSMSEEKKAKLAAIRAANAAKAAEQGDASAAEQEAAPAAEPATPAPDTEPATGASEAPAASSGSLPFRADNLTGGVPENTTMSEEKVEKLRAIRQGNLNKQD